MSLPPALLTLLYDFRKMSLTNSRCIGGCIAIAYFIGIAAPTLSAETVVVSLTGDPTPDGNGNLDKFEPPVLNDAGEVAFVADLVNTANEFADDSGVYRGDGIRPLVQVYREGSAPPDGNGAYNDFGREYAIGASGQVVIIPSIRDAVGGASEGVFRSNGNLGNGTRIVRDADTVVGGNGTFTSYSIPLINDAGQVAFRAGLDDTTGGPFSNLGIYIGDGVSSPMEIARGGLPVPGGNGTFRSLSMFPALNRVGQVAFQSRIEGSSGGFNDDQAIYRGDGVTALVAMVREGDSLPINGTLGTGLGDPALNDAGQIAFKASFLTNTLGGNTDDIGIFRGDVPTSLVEIARKGKSSPDGNGVFSDFGDPTLNNLGQAAFRAFSSGTTDGRADDGGIYRGDGTALSQIAREGQTTPDGNGAFTSFGFPALNDSGQMAFSGRQDPNNTLGIYFHDDGRGLVSVALKGDPLLGSTITDLFLNTNNSPPGNQRDWLNDRGQVSFQFELADGREGIAIWSPPQLMITDVSLAGTMLTVHFSGEAGVTGWKVFGSSDLRNFGDDRTAQSTISEATPGNYTAEVGLDGTPPSYFVRIHR